MLDALFRAFRLAIKCPLYPALHVMDLACVADVIDDADTQMRLLKLQDNRTAASAVSLHPCREGDAQLFSGRIPAAGELADFGLLRFDVFFEPIEHQNALLRVARHGTSISPMES